MDWAEEVAMNYTWDDSLEVSMQLNVLEFLPKPIFLLIVRRAVCRKKCQV